MDFEKIDLIWQVNQWPLWLRRIYVISFPIGFALQLILSFLAIAIGIPTIVFFLCLWSLQDIWKRKPSDTKPDQGWYL